MPGFFAVLRCTNMIRVRMIMPLSSPVKCRPFGTTPLALGILPYRSKELRGLNPDACTFSVCGEVAETTERLLKCFSAIQTESDMFEVKWDGVSDELVDFASPKLKLHVSKFYSENRLLHGKEEFSYLEYYSAIADEQELQHNPAIAATYKELYNAYLSVYRELERSKEFTNDKVKYVMSSVMKASLLPMWHLYGRIYEVWMSTTTLMDQTLALKVGAIDVTSRKKNYKTFEGVSDAALVNINYDNTQLLIGEGKGETAKVNGLNQLVMAILAQCALSACTQHTIWGFTLNPIEYIIVKLEVIDNDVVLTQYPPCHHLREFDKFLPLMGPGFVNMLLKGMSLHLPLPSQHMNSYLNSANFLPPSNSYIAESECSEPSL